MKNYEDYIKLNESKSEINIYLKYYDLVTNKGMEKLQDLIDLMSSNTIPPYIIWLANTSKNKEDFKRLAIKFE